jgi:hypothetical protein
VAPTRVPAAANWRLNMVVMGDKSASCRRQLDVDPQVRGLDKYIGRGHLGRQTKKSCGSRE